MSDLSNDLTISVSASNFQGNQYKQMFQKDLGRFCDCLYKPTLENIFNEAHLHGKVKVPWKTCPYPKGPNEFYNFLLQDFGSLLPPYMPGGEKWKMQVRYFNGSELLGGYNMFAILRNEQSLLNGG
jgi:hypothetical protein